jgi:hypothetical protein
MSSRNGSAGASRLIVPMTVLAAVIVTAGLLTPVGAVGGERPTGAGTGDRYVFGRDATFVEPVAGNVQVYGGSARVENVIQGDLLVLGGSVVLADGGRVAGNIIHAGGSVTGADGRVGGRVYPVMTLEGAAATMSKTGVSVTLLFVWFVVAIVVTLASGRQVRFSSVEVRVSALYCFALGLVAFTSFVLTALVFSYLVPYLIGIPLLAALGVFAVMAKVYGMVAVFHAVGSALARGRTRQQLAARSWVRGDLAMVVIGLLILGAVRLIPVIGAIAWSCASVFGIGVALATRFGRREPAFLAWRPAEA